MVLFTLFLLGCIIFCMFDKVWFTSKWQKNIIQLYFMLYVLTFSGFRYGFSWDYFQYVALYNGINTEFSKLEPVFNYLIDILRACNFNYQGLFLVYAILIYLFIFIGFKNYSPDFLMSCMFFIVIPRLYFESLSTIRQFLAIAIVFWAAKYIVSKKDINYILSVVFATLCHYSAIVMLPVYWLAKKTYTMRTYTYMLLVSIALYFFSQGILSVVMNRLLEVFPEYAIVVKYSVYLNDEFTIGNLMAIAVETIIWICVIRRKDFMPKNSLTTVTLNMYSFSVFGYYIFSFYDTFLRIVTYFNMFKPVALVLYANTLTKEKRLIFYFVLFVFYTLTLFRSITIYEQTYLTEIALKFNFNLFK